MKYEIKMKYREQHTSSYCELKVIETIELNGKSFVNSSFWSLSLIIFPKKIVSTVIIYIHQIKCLSLAVGEMMLWWEEMGKAILKIRACEISS